MCHSAPPLRRPIPASQMFSTYQYLEYRYDEMDICKFGIRQGDVRNARLEFTDYRKQFSGNARGSPLRIALCIWMEAKDS